MILSGAKPLFNRKYLLALVWLLPLTILLLNRLTPSNEIYFESLGPDQMWVRAEDHTTSIYFTQGQGISSESRSKQALLVAGLNLNLESSKILALLAEQNWQVQALTSSIYTALEVTSQTPIDSAALLNFIDLLKQPPAVDWSDVIGRIDAQVYLAAQQGRQRALDALVGSSATPLNARNYLELADQHISLMFKSPEKPKPLSYNAGSMLPSTPATKGSVAVRGDQPANFALWQLPEPKTSAQYLAQQAAGALLAQRMAKQPDMRIQQQLSPEGTNIIMETGANAGMLDIPHAQAPSDDELELVIESLEKRWTDALNTRAAAWPEVLLLYRLEPVAIDEAFEQLRQEASELINHDLQYLQQPSSRQARILTANN